MFSGFEIFSKMKFNINTNIVRVHLAQRFQEHPKPDRRGDQEPVGRNQGGLWRRLSEEVEEDCPEKSSRGKESNSKKTNVINKWGSKLLSCSKLFFFKTD